MTLKKNIEESQVKLLIIVINYAPKLRMKTRKINGKLFYLISHIFVRLECPNL
ncbi:hypothetical protein C2G38_2124256 [Gigaspora rosea]|uniref:Uncharacterized protein n=1 Tax=Gigaspora rosea TaxID=44941 RepID=A0A397TY07_9GLOM|nr:hypothetical protein C2G38_2124256 [Gigaspora rosea]